MEVLHTPICSKKQNEAEILLKRNITTKDCPRCNLNKAAPDLLRSCEIAVLALTHEPIHPDDIEYLKQVIDKAK